MSKFTNALFSIPALLLTGTIFAGDVLIYYGDAGLPLGYTNFSFATGKTIVYMDSLPSDLSSFDCIILPLNGYYGTEFSVPTLVALDGFINGGGRIIAQAEWVDETGQGFPGPVAAMNGLAAYLGADLSLNGALLDSGPNVTANIDLSPFTAGVSSIFYGATSEVVVAVGPSAHSLVRTAGSDTTFIGAEQIGSGVFVLTGDSNVFSDNSGNGYTVHDNGILAANICDSASLDIQVAIDIKFCSDPNAFNCKRGGSLPVTVFGAEGFDVTDIDPASLKLCLASNHSVCTGAPIDYSLADRGNPDTDIGAAMCAVVNGVEQNYLTQDYLLDLDAAFHASEVQTILGDFCGADKGALSEALVLIGATWDGMRIISVPVGNLGIDQLLKQNK